MDKNKHSQPIGIVFDYSKNESEKNRETLFPYNMKVYISTFSHEISATNETFPYVQPVRNPNRGTFYSIIFWKFK